MRDVWRRPLRALSVGALALSGIAAGSATFIGSALIAPGTAGATPPACTDSWKTAASGTWDTAADWSTGSVPGPSDVACITVAGTYTVTYQPSGGTETVDALVLGSGVSGDHESLNLVGTCSDNVNLITKNSLNGTDSNLIASTGALTLTSTGCGNNSTLSIGTTLVNQGTLDVLGGAGGARTITGGLTNDGTVAIDASTTYSTGTLDNAGALDLGDADALTVATATPASTVTNDTGGSIVSNGTNATGQLIVDGGNTYNQGNGTTSGEPVLLAGPASGAGIALHYTGNGASTLVAEGGTGTLDGAIVHGQTLSINGTCSNNATYTVDQSETNAGTVHLTSSGCGNSSALTVAATDTFTNSAGGNLDIDSAAGGARTITGNVTNDGTVTDNASATFEDGTWDNAGALDLGDADALTVATATPVSTFTNDTGGSIVSSGTNATGQLVVDGGNAYNQGNGTTSGEPVLLAGPASGTGIALHYTGTGASTIVAQGGTGTLDGPIVAGQTLTVNGTCAINASYTVDQNETNAGTVHLSSSACGNNSTLAVATGKTFTNQTAGVVDIDSAAGGARTVTGNVTNKGHVNVNANATYSTGAWTNTGPLAIASAVTLSSPAAAGVVFTNNTGGSITATGSGELELGGANAFNEGAGTLSGTVPVLLSGPTSGTTGAVALHYTGTGSGPIRAEGLGTVDGTMSSGQILDVVGACGDNADELIDAPMATTGTIDLTSTGCGNNATLAGKNAGGADILTVNAGGVLQSDAGAGGARTISDDVVLHKGVLNVNTATSYTAEKKGITNKKGTVNLAATLTETGVSGSAFVNKKGSIAGAGELLVDGPSTFNEAAGTIAAGTTVLVDGANLEYTGNPAKAGAGIIETEGTSSLTAGAPSAGQTVLVNGVCGLNAFLDASGSLTDNGAIELTSSGCGNSSAFVLPSGDALTIGSTGSLTWPTGAGGSRTITGNLINGGTLGNTGVENTLSVSGTVNLGSSGTYAPSVSTGSSDEIAAGGVFTLGGKLNPNGTFTSGHSYTIGIGSAVSGSFSQTNGWTIGGTSTTVTMSHA